jgi:hypothetical protein
VTAGPEQLVVAVLGPGRLGETHVAAPARLRDRGLRGDGRNVPVVPALYGRNADRVRRLAERYGLDRTSTRLDDPIEAAYAEQCAFVESHAGRVILMASRAMAASARSTPATQLALARSRSQQ